MLRGYKSPGAFTISGNYNSAIMKMDARLSFRHDKDRNVVLAIHGIRQKPELERPFFGHEFSKEDKANLLETGNNGTDSKPEKLYHGRNDTLFYQRG